MKGHKYCIRFSSEEIRGINYKLAKIWQKIVFQNEYLWNIQFIFVFEAKKKGGGNIISFCSILFKQQMYEKLLKQNITCSKLPICSFNNMENTIL